MKDDKRTERIVLQGNYFSGPTALQGQGVQINIADGKIIPVVDPSQWPTVDNLNAIELGVHRAAEDASGSVVPTYVARDVDDVIDDLLETARNSGGFVLLVGHSAAGKTRSAFEAMRRNLTGFRVFRASVPRDVSLFVQVIRSLEVGRAVLWLDDLERFFGEGGINAALVGDLIRLRVVVIATLRHGNYDRYRKKIGHSPSDSSIESENHAAYNGARVLDLVDPVTIRRDWTIKEQERAKQVGDARFFRALKSFDGARVSEYLAAGPQLWRSYEAALRDGKKHIGPQLVRAAIDLRRTGIKSPLPTELLVRVAEIYDHFEAPGSRQGRDAAKGLSWASKIRDGITSFLTRAGEGAWEPFDYLIDAAALDPHQSDIPLAVWRASLEYADGDDLFSVGWVLYLNEMYELAASAMCQLAEAGVPLAMSNLGVILHKLGRSEEAARWHAKSASLGHPAGQFNLGVRAYEELNHEQAESLWMKSADGGEVLAMQALGILCLEQARHEDAEKWWKRGADTGDPVSAYRLGLHLSKQGRNEEAEAWWRQSAQAGHPYSCLRLGNALALREKRHKAEQWWRRARELGIESAEGQEITTIENAVTGINCVGTNLKIREKLGVRGLSATCNSLWPVDCQTCGKPLGEYPPSLTVSDLLVFSYAELHHLQCRTPEWSEGGGLHKNSTVSWTCLTFMLPIEETEDITGYPCFLVNPSLEAVHLKPVDGGWQVSPLRSFLQNGFAYMRSDLIIDQPVSSGHRSLYDPYCVMRGSEIVIFESPAYIWSAELDYDVKRSVVERGGILVAVCSYIRPDLDLMLGALIQSMLSREVALGWVPLSSTGSPLPRHVPAPKPAELYGAFQSSGEAIVGRMLGRAPRSLNAAQAQAWALDEIDVDSDRLLPWNLTSHSGFYYTIDALSVRQYALYLRDDGWVISELLVRHGGTWCANNSELTEWANRIIDVHLKAGSLEWVDKEAAAVEALAIESKVPD